MTNNVFEPFEKKLFVIFFNIRSQNQDLNFWKVLILLEMTLLGSESVIVQQKAISRKKLTGPDQTGVLSCWGKLCRFHHEGSSVLSSPMV